MGTTLRKPHLISWLAIPALIVLGILFSRYTVDVQLADTYYVIGKLHFVAVASLFLLVVGSGYWMLSRNGRLPNRILTAIHLLLTLAALVAFVLPFSNSNWLAWIAMAFLLSQLLYIINMFMALFQHNPVNHY